MPDGGHRCTEDTLRDLAEVVASPATELPGLLSRLLAEFVPHDALLLLSASATGGHVSSVGDRDFADSLSLLDLDEYRRSLGPNSSRLTILVVAGASVPTLQLVSGNGALLIMARPFHGEDVGESGPTGRAARIERAAQVWNVVALRVQDLADAAPPGYLQLARESSGERMDALAELADEYSTTLASVLAALRSASLGDRAARLTATSIAANGISRLRKASSRVRTVTEEPVTTAFNRLREDIGPFTRHREIDVQFVEPPEDGRPLPSEVAHGARAVVRGSIMALVDRPDVRRVRVKWDCDGSNLLVEMRDDGSGEPTPSDGTQFELVRHRVQALGGTLVVHATPGWGTEMAITIPLDPPHLVTSGHPLAAALGPREIEVLHGIAAGHRNRDIATDLRISENTVKFHISSIYRKIGMHTRAEAAGFYLALARPQGASTERVYSARPAPRAT
ncbi:LuxR C-terminal-related transcriptional regulator [Microbacterium sp. Leaf288]|uniref:LuxR C-terminal-related transcriptional regulator n=1 Tax=Microbacterium sp. Leaf288 TaxID=1736323 RepID=UPI0009E825D1|nr:LuxR C-terminal-related transcriptional regulator [Microbacterium sp. Leaf288]